MGFSLWIVPPSNVMGELKKIMAIRPGEPHSSSSSYPSFAPHITLASVISSDPEIPLSKLRECIPTNQPAFQIKFKSVEVGDHYFRSVYVAIRLSTQLDSDLIDLHREVHRRLGIQPRTPKFPHLSLVYVSDEDASLGERDAYLRVLKERELILQERSSGDGGEGPDGGVKLRSGHDGEWINGFQASEIWIAKCEGPVENWEVLDRITLQD